MIIGVPKEVKADEHRVALTPDKVDLLVKAGHRVAVETGAGLGADFSDEDFESVGADVLGGAKEVFDAAEIVVKVKEPQPHEYEYFRSSQTIFTFLHLAAQAELTSALLSAGVTSVAYETVQALDGSLPLLYPMSEIAGRLAPQVASRLLQNTSGGPGRLLGGVPGTAGARVAIIGGGTVGFNAALVASALGANVTIADVSLERLRFIGLSTHLAVDTISSTPVNLEKLLSEADVVIGAVLVPGARAPKVVTKATVGRMRPGSILIDVAIDQGGSVEAIRPTTHQAPTYLEQQIVHYAVPNMPGVVGSTSSVSLSNATYPYVLELANLGVEKSIRADGALAKGVNTHRGQVTHRAVADALGVEYVPALEALAA